jgi:outer membrane murein-binding lipoprotein Lpp
MRWSVTQAAVGGLAAVLAGCADYSGVEKDLRQLRDQLNQVSVDVAAMKTSLDNATEETRQAQQKAQAAARTANQALTVASEDRKAIDELNAKIDRLAQQQPHRRASATSASASASSAAAKSASSSSAK